jgi:hypothetical protein
LVRHLAPSTDLVAAHDQHGLSTGVDASVSEKRLNVGGERLLGPVDALMNLKEGPPRALEIALITGLVFAGTST